MAAPGLPNPDPHPELCPGCGYDVRGHRQDPIRCPECGRVTSRWEFAIGDRELLRFSGMLESIPTASVACLVSAALVWGVPFLPDSLAVIPAAGCLHCVHWFGRLSKRKPGWWRILVGFHLVGVLGVGAVGVALAGALYLCRAITEGSTVGVACGALGSSCGAVGLAVVFLAYRRVKVGLTRMLRESSIELARIERSLRSTGWLRRVRLLSYLDAED